MEPQQINKGQNGFLTSVCRNTVKCFNSCGIALDIVRQT